MGVRYMRERYTFPREQREYKWGITGTAPLIRNIDTRHKPLFLTDLKRKLGPQPVEQKAERNIKRQSQNGMAT